jgi:hypothetical protein
MKAAILVVLAAAGLAALSVASCSVHRLSDSFTCDPAGDGHECGSDRFCSEGFCVQTGCPGPCTTCDVGDRTCRIDCTDKSCGNVQCPAGYDCTIRCTNGGTCGAVDCAQAHSCDVDCSGPGSCGNLNCGKSACTIRCSGVLACPLIDCADACSCDVFCNNPASCPSMSCPMGTLEPCTDQGSAGGLCSSDPPGCDKCP